MALQEKCKLADENPQLFLTYFAELLERIQLENESSNVFLRCYHSKGTLAKNSEDLIRKKRGKTLFGSIFAAKDNYQVKGHPLTFGLQAAICDQAPAHAELIQRCIDCGATLIGSTNLDAACLESFGDNPYYGRVANPRFRGWITGGSSSGSAAAVAGGFADFAIGTDYGGSVRLPAAACGIFGLKSSGNSLPQKGIVLFDQEMDKPGLLTASLPDLRFVLETICGSAAQSTAPEFIVPPPEELHEMDGGQKQKFYCLLERLQKSFRVRRLDAAVGLQESLEARKTLAASAFLNLVRQYLINEDALPPAGKALLALNRSLTAKDKERAACQAAALSERVAALLSKETFIITPSLPATPPSWSAVQHGRATSPLNRFLTLANVCDLPALSMPIFPAEADFPYSLQIIGSSGNDHGVVLAAERILLSEDGQNRSNLHDFHPAPQKS